jgi:hypothetical protein
MGCIADVGYFYYAYFDLAPVGWVALFNPTDPIETFINHVYTAPTAMKRGLMPLLHKIYKAL